jgi:hypothetical protein
LEPERGITHDRQVLGTPSYMAPEQARAEAVGPAADWYAVGVMLFECLTGRLPHEGPALKQLIAKQDATPDPADRVAEAPEELRTLCMRLLSRDPHARPRGRELLQRLHAAVPSAVDRAPIFVGRRKELAVLRAALDDAVEHREPVVVHLRGRSGDGKSALVRRFRNRLRNTDAIVLDGRCREHETVPYKGVDAIVDALSAHLRRLPEPRRAELRPPDLDALVRVFPVLDEIWPAAEPQVLSPNEVRKLGGVTLQKLLRRITDAQPLLVHIDDLQWADLDSVSLLQELIRPPAAPAMMLLLSYRSDTEGSPALRELAVSEALAGHRTRMIELGPLPAAEACELARELLHRSDATDPRQRTHAEAIALRSRGSPFFITQLVLGGGSSDTADSDLDHIVARRLAGLGAKARRLLEVMAVFGGPLPVDLALELGSSAGGADVDTLSEQGLLVREHFPTDDQSARIETAHDRVREVVLAELAADARARLHWRIGERLLERHDQDPREDSVFAIVDHLHAGMAAAGVLTPERRLALAELGHTAGQRAQESTAWITAQRCSVFAHALVDPWLSEAREGRGHHALCVAIVFGRAQAEITLDDPHGDALLAELLAWSLSETDHLRIAEWYGITLSTKLRTEERVAFSTTTLARLGIDLPRRPSWFRALLSYFWGWWSISRFGIDRLRSLPTVTDERTRMALEHLAGIATSAVATDVRLHLAAMGRYIRMLVKHGFHEGTPVTLAALAFSAAFRGRAREALALCDVAQDLAEKHHVSSFVRHGLNVQVILVLPLLRPIRTVVADAEPIYQRTCELAPRAIVEMFGLFHAANCHRASLPLPRMVELVDSMEARQGGFMLGWVADATTGLRRTILALMGASAEPAIASGLRNLQANPHYLIAMNVWQLFVSALLGHTEAARDVDRVLSREHNLGMGWYVPNYVMMSTIVMADRWPHSTRGERWRMRWAFRKRRAVARQWAKRCRENYQPLLNIVDAEIAAVDERYDDAVTSYERARSGADAEGLTWLVGLASERLAKLARRRGHGLIAEAAFDAAQRAYEAWGAAAVVRRIERERASART